MLCIFCTCSGNSQDFIANILPKNSDGVITRVYLQYSSKNNRFTTMQSFTPGHDTIKYKLPLVTRYYRTMGTGKKTIYSDTVFLNVSMVKVTGLQITPVSLSWVTFGESNLYYFNVQRSTDGAKYTQLGRVYAKGDGLYTFTIAKTSKKYFYRLVPIYRDASADPPILF